MEGLEGQVKSLDLNLQLTGSFYSIKQEKSKICISDLSFCWNRRQAVGREASKKMTAHPGKKG